MVRFICIMLLLCNCCHAQLFETKINSDHIRIDQVGPRDHMLEAVILTVEKVELRFPERPVKINRHIFDSLCGYIDKCANQKPAILLPEIDVNEFGIFKVTLRTEGRTRIFVTRNRESAVAFLTGFREQLKNLTAPDESIKKTETILQKITY
jgi:hypothetical protein